MACKKLFVIVGQLTIFSLRLVDLHVDIEPWSTPFYTTLGRIILFTLNFFKTPFEKHFSKGSHTELDILGT